MCTANGFQFIESDREYGIVNTFPYSFLSVFDQQVHYFLMVEMAIEKINNMNSNHLVVLQLNGKRECLACLFGVIFAEKNEKRYYLKADKSGN